MAKEEVNESEDGEGVEGEEGAASKGKLNKKLLIILLPVILLAIGGGLYFTGVIGGGGDDETHVEGAEHAGEGADGELTTEGEGITTNAAFFALPDFIVNLSSAGGSRFLKLRVQLELKDEADLAAIEAITPRVIDQFQTYLREMRVEDLRGSAGIYRLRQELLYRVNIAAHPVKVTDVLFQEMLIQ